MFQERVRAETLKTIIRAVTSIPIMLKSTLSLRYISIV